jgi:hypothetical protein
MNNKIDMGRMCGDEFNLQEAVRATCEQGAIVEARCRRADLLLRVQKIRDIRRTVQAGSVLAQTK